MAVRTIHMIGHGHIDPVWLWRWQEGFEEIRATFRSALERMRESEDICFTASSACFYDWIKTCEPEMFEEIRMRVAEGRWEIAGGWWIEPDCNLPLGESFVRQGLIGQHFFKREFGKRATVGFNPDSFGHCASLPQILQGQGMRRYIYMRPNPGHDGGERAYPGGTTFVWRAADGSEVLASVIQESYNSTDNSPECLEYLRDCPHLNEGQKQVMGFFGVGNHGGGPTKKAIAGIVEAQKKFDMTVLFSTLERYLTAFEKDHARAQLPVVQDELQHHARGCYSAHAGIKRLMRESEHALLTAERFAFLASETCGFSYPKDELDAAWRTLLFNQFHDILAGSSIETAYEDARDQLGAVRNAANTIMNTAMQLIARQIDTSMEGNSIVVFNPLPWPTRQCVAPSPLALRTLCECVEVVDATGHMVAHQQILGPHVGSRTVSFMADLPALGYAVYNVRNIIKETQADTTLSIGENWMENPWWRIELDSQEGFISRLYDKVNNVDVLQRGARLLCVEDPSDTWSHRVKRYDGTVGNFGGAMLDVLECGPVRATLRVRSKHNASQAHLQLTLYSDDSAIDLQYRVNWQEQYTVLKLGFMLNTSNNRVTCETPYGVQERASNGEEEPMQQWLDVSGDLGGQGYGLGIINDAKFAYDSLGAELRITCLRSPAFAHHDPDVYKAEEPFAIMDQGWHEFSFRLVPHAGTWRDAHLQHLAWAFNNPPKLHIESAHPGDWPLLQSFMSSNAPNVQWCVLKRQDDGVDGRALVRGYEFEGRETACHIELLGVSFAVAFPAFAIRTFLLDLNTGEAAPCDLLEQPLEN